MKSIKSIKFITKSLRSITIFIALYKIQLKKKTICRKSKAPNTYTNEYS